MVNRKELTQDEHSSFIYISIAVLIAFAFLLVANFAPTPAKPQTAPEDQFSALRAELTMRRILPEQQPHPIGTDENLAVVDRIVAEFAMLGYQAEIEPTYITDSYGSFIGLNNILVRIPGSSGKQTVMLMAHHDSVAAAPGYADDLHAVGVMLEIARALKVMPQLQQDVLMLITDGEEFGLLGAKAFARDHQEFLSEISCILNMEARGTRGPSFMFESGPGSGDFVKAFLDSSPKPIATSLFPTFYDLLPNDTDFSIFKRLNMQGLNFAFIDGLPRYHSPIDNIENLDLDTIQHQGESVFNAMVAIASSETLKPSEALVYFDLAGAFTISWPISWTIWLASIALLISIVAIFLSAAVRAITLKQIVLGLFFVLTIMVIFTVCGMGFAELFKLISGENIYWYAHASYYSVTFFAGLLGIGLLLSHIFHKPLEPLAVMLSSWLIVSLLGVVLALVLPGSSYLFIATALVGGSFALSAGLLRYAGQTSIIVASSISTLFSQTIFIPVIIGGLIGMGFSMSPLQSIPSIVIFLSILPLLLLMQKKQLMVSGSVLLLASLLLFVGIVFIPSYSDINPQPVNYKVFQENVEDTAIWTTAKNTFANKINFANEDAISELEQRYQFIDLISTLRYNGKDRVVAGILNPSEAAPEPTVTLISSNATADDTTYRLRIEPVVDFPFIQLLFPPQKAPERVILHHPALGDLAIMNELSSRENWTGYTLYTVPAEGLEITMVVPSLDSFELTTLAMQWGIPAWATSLNEVRQQNNAMPNSRGDSWYVVGRHTIQHTEE